MGLESRLPGARQAVAEAGALLWALVGVGGQIEIERRRHFEQASGGAPGVEGVVEQGLVQATLEALVGRGQEAPSARFAGGAEGEDEEGGAVGRHHVARYGAEVGSVLVGEGILAFSVGGR